MHTANSRVLLGSLPSGVSRRDAQIGRSQAEARERRKGYISEGSTLQIENLGLHLGARKSLVVSMVIHHGHQLVASANRELQLSNFFH